LCEAQPPSDATAEEAGAGPGYFFALNDLLLQCTAAAFSVSNEISATYFTHSSETNQSMRT
jgi:hypothetical protein